MSRACRRLSVEGEHGRRRWDAWIFLMMAMVAVSVLGLAWEARAEDDPAKKELPDRFMIRGGWAYVFGVNADVTVRGERTGIGTSVDFGKTLGGDDSTNALRIDALYRFNDRHSIGFSWYRVALGGENTILDQQIQIGDSIISANASIQSDLNLNLYRFLYNYSFYRTDKVELALSPGVYMASTKFGLTAQGNITLPNSQPATATGVKEDVTVPLPSFGLLMNYNITSRFQFQTRADFFYFNAASYEGSMFEFYAGLEYRLFKHLAVGAAYDRLSADLQDTNHDGWEFDFSYNLAFVYGSLYF